MNKFFISILFSILSLWLIIPNKIYAHGFGERYDLPIPLTYFLVGGSVTILFSFLILIVFFNKEYKINHNKSLLIFKENTLSKIPSVLFKNALKILSVSLFLLTIISGYIGSNNPIENFSAPFVWIIWWVGFGIITPLIGDFWKSLNPVKILYLFIINNVIKNPEMIHKGKYKYPKSLDSWPLIISFILFSWFENVGNGSNPQTLATLVSVYTVLTFVCMYLYGPKDWLEKGDVFSVYYHIMGSFGIFKLTQNKYLQTTEVNLRLPVTGLTELKTPSTLFVVFHIILLGTISFDGLSETTFWTNVEIIFIPALGKATTETLGIILIPSLFFILLWFVCKIVSVITKEKSTEDILTSFVFSLTPIAIAYHIAHYLAYILITGQLIIPVISDPFGYGWDLIGTQNYALNIGVINAKDAWYSSIIIIVLGHVFSVIVSHINAVKIFSNNTLAIKSQIPFLILMIFYTALSLWIIAQPIVNH